MERKDTVKFLQYPSAQIIDLAMSMANLTIKEEHIIRLYAQKGMTQEALAEHEDVSVNAIQRWIYSAEDKLVACWSGINWIETLLGSL